MKKPDIWNWSNFGNFLICNFGIFFSLFSHFWRPKNLQKHFFFKFYNFALWRISPSKNYTGNSNHVAFCELSTCQGTLAPYVVAEQMNAVYPTTTVELLWVKTLHFVLQNVPLRYILPPNESPWPGRYCYELQHRMRFREVFPDVTKFSCPFSAFSLQDLQLQVQNRPLAKNKLALNTH